MSRITPMRDQGFTAVEVLVTLFIAVGFVILLNTLCLTILRASASAQNQANASASAYANLRKYAYAGATPTWFTADCASNTSAPGKTLDSGSLSAAQTTLPQPVTYSITAYAPYGCGTTTKPPVLITSTIQYGPSSLKATHATYVGY